MIHIERSLEPKCLIENGDRWLKSFQDGVVSRPSSRQYGHAEIRDALHAMSFNKCFYCEQKLSEHAAQVEHFLEVSDRPELAFVWTNLYLSCSGCNHAKRKRDPGISECLDPCGAGHDPAEHLTFDDEFVRSRTGSAPGRKTVQKYGLNRDDLVQKRIRGLHYFERFLRMLYQRGLSLTAADKEKVASFAQPEHEFSLMFRVYLGGVGA